jgi:hypothetical protein
MGWWPVIDAAIVVIIVATPLVWLLVRRRWLTRQGGLFDCTLRVPRRTGGQRWVLGVARYTGDYLEWFPVFSASFRPRLRLHRTDAQVVSQRSPSTDEVASLYGGSKIVTLRVASARSERELAMSAASMTGLMSWLESAPPGQRYTAFLEQPREDDR